MNTISPQHTSDRRRRRLHSDEFKANAVALAAQPGMSMAAVAMSLGINANLLRRWVRDTGVQPCRSSPIDAPKVFPSAASVPAAAELVPVHLSRAVWPATSSGDICVEVRRGAWLRELLR
ncbi:transposase [Variovorax boronicumulans]|uniref:transposase n=1 Tax=Variovorax boronicumulans TaxID=436515 RepID=UPI003396E06D